MVAIATRLPLESLLGRVAGVNSRLSQFAAARDPLRGELCSMLRAEAADARTELETIRPALMLAATPVMTYPEANAVLAKADQWLRELSQFREVEPWEKAFFEEINQDAIELLTEEGPIVCNRLSEVAALVDQTEWAQPEQIGQLGKLLDVSRNSVRRELDRRGIRYKNAGHKRGLALALNDLPEALRKRLTAGR